VAPWTSSCIVFFSPRGEVHCRWAIDRADLISCCWDNDPRIVGSLDWGGEIEVGARRDLDFLSMKNSILKKLIMYKQSSPQPSEGQEDSQYLHFENEVNSELYSTLKERFPRSEKVVI
jgi:hypothetical protein